MSRHARLPGLMPLGLRKNAGHRDFLDLASFADTNSNAVRGGGVASNWRLASRGRTGSCVVTVLDIVANTSLQIRRD